MTRRPRAVAKVGAQVWAGLADLPALRRADQVAKRPVVRRATREVKAARPPPPATELKWQARAATLVTAARARATGAPAPRVAAAPRVLQGRRARAEARRTGAARDPAQVPEEAADPEVPRRALLERADPEVPQRGPEDQVARARVVLPAARPEAATAATAVGAAQRVPTSSRLIYPPALPNKRDSAVTTVFFAPANFFKMTFAGCVSRDVCCQVTSHRKMSLT
jgi:hypothetical protein